MRHIAKDDAVTFRYVRLILALLMKLLLEFRDISWCHIFPHLFLWKMDYFLAASFVCIMIVLVFVHRKEQSTLVKYNFICIWTPK